MTNLRFQAIGIAGQLGAGKSSVARALADSLGWHYGSFGNYVREIAAERGLEQTRDNLQTMGEDLIRDLPAAEFVRQVIDRSGWERGRGLVVEGIRHDHIAEALRTFVHPTSYALVYLDAPKELRELRIRERGRAESSDLARAEKHSTERQVATLIREQADFVIRAANDIEATLSEICRGVLAKA